MSANLLIVLFATLLILLQAQAWTACSKSCGSGTQSRKTCFWGLCSTSHQLCNTHACISGWNTWQPCSTSCGGGTKYKVKSCNENDIYKCPKFYEDCNTHSCPATRCLGEFKHRYGDISSCCNKTVAETCGTMVTPTGSRTRVIGGVEAKLGQWPWMAVLVDKKKKGTHCTGSLIHNDWVLTAAHCLVYPPTQAPFKKEDVYILLGSKSINKPAATSQTSEIESFIPHGDYVWNKVAQHDLGLIKLKTPAIYSLVVKPVCLPGGEIVQQDTRCYVAGWGSVSNQNRIDGKGSDVLMQAAIRIVPLDSCAQGLRQDGAAAWNQLLEKHNICAGVLSGKVDTCMGDSGGPLVCQRCSSCGWYLAGATSFGAFWCATPGVPAVYTNIRSYEHWIRKRTSVSTENSFVC